VRVNGREGHGSVCKLERDRFVKFVLDDIELIPASDRIRGHARFENDNTIIVDDDSG
jgi:dihydrolipoamide dehydrogenase